MLDLPVDDVGFAFSRRNQRRSLVSRESLLSIIIFNQIWFYVDGVARTEVSGVDYKLNWQGTKHVTM